MSKWLALNRSQLLLFAVLLIAMATVTAISSLGGRSSEDATLQPNSSESVTESSSDNSEGQTSTTQEPRPELPRSDELEAAILDFERVFHARPLDLTVAEFQQQLMSMATPDSTVVIEQIQPLNDYFRDLRSRDIEVVAEPQITSIMADEAAAQTAVVSVAVVVTELSTAGITDVDETSVTRRWQYDNETWRVNLKEQQFDH